MNPGAWSISNTWLEGIVMRFASLSTLCVMLMMSLQPAYADWAVAQSNHDEPFLQRFRSLQMAQDDALAACNQGYQSCRVVISGDSGCVAIATTGSQWGVAKAGSQSRADAGAMAVCEGLNAGACKIEHQFCGR
ncbi:MAG: DUF4189 domain-containing protein [Alphaproteobacteria bacterium]|nr:MAG: DUF4189 domain-containing protein [Alphaproteobacteria bacterium]